MQGPVARVIGDNRRNSRLFLRGMWTDRQLPAGLSPSSASDFSFCEPAKRPGEGSSAIVRERGGFTDRFSGPRDAEEEVRGNQQGLTGGRGAFVERFATG